MRIAALLLIYVGLSFYLGTGILNGLRAGRVPHRWYLLEKNRNRNYATRRDNPIEYWASLAAQLVLWSLVSTPVWSKLY